LRGVERAGGENDVGSDEFIARDARAVDALAPSIRTVTGVGGWSE